MFNRPAFTRVELQNGDGIREAGARSRQLVPRRDSAVAGDFDLSQRRSTVADGDTRGITKGKWLAKERRALTEDARKQGAEERVERIKKGASDAPIHIGS
jgi:hypothetical protein